jgi:DUF1680 family protein
MVQRQLVSLPLHAALLVHGQAWTGLHINREWYTMGHLLPGKDDFLRVAVRIGNVGYEMFRSQNEDMAHFPINSSTIVGAVELYRETGDPRHLALASTVIDIRGKYPGGTDCWQDRVPLRRHGDEQMKMHNSSPQRGVPCEVSR